MEDLLESLPQLLLASEGTEQNVPCAVVASGWSLNDCPAWQLRQDVIIAVNNAYSWLQGRDIRPDWLCSIDSRFWQEHPNAEESVTCNRIVYPNYMQICGKDSWHNLEGITPKDTDNRLIAHGSSAHAALHFAIILGCDPIFLCGVDLCHGPNGEIYAKDDKHVFDPNERQQQWDKMHEAFEFMAKHIRPGRVWDCSPEGELTAFPKIGTRYGMDHDRKYNR